MMLSRRCALAKIGWYVVVLIILPFQIIWAESPPPNAQLPDEIQIGGLSPSLSFLDKDFSFLGGKYRIRWYSDYSGKNYPIITCLPDQNNLLKEEVITDEKLLETLFIFKDLFPHDLPLLSHYQPYLDFYIEHWKSKKEKWEKMVEVWDPNDADWMTICL